MRYGWKDSQVGNVGHELGKMGKSRGEGSRGDGKSASKGKGEEDRTLEGLGMSGIGEPGG